MGYPSHASEFPNDNAAISSGTIWIHPDLTGPAVAELAPFEAVPSESFVLYFDDEDAVAEGPVELAIAESKAGVAVVAVAAPDSKRGPERPLSPAAAPQWELEFPADVAALAEPGTPASLEPLPQSPADSPAFVHFERALTAALLTQGSTRSAALVPRLLRLETLPADAAGKDVWLTLQSRGYIDGNGRYSQKYRELCGAWAALLQGTSQDFSACGTTTLDRFGADLLAALLAVPTTRADELRRQLRKAGIAAFGVLEAA